MTVTVFVNGSIFCLQTYVVGFGSRGSDDVVPPNRRRSLSHRNYLSGASDNELPFARKSHVLRLTPEYGVTSEKQRAWSIGVSLFGWISPAIC